jgi:hypothetical protein
MTDYHSRGKGENNPCAKMTNARVQMLREYRAGGWPHAELSWFFGISQSRSSEICRGRAYPDAPGPIEKGPKQQYYTAERNPNRKASPEIAQFVKAVYAEGGWTHAQIAGKIQERFGVEVSKSLVGKILTGVVERDT